MFMYMTTGTARFLKTVTDAHPKLDFNFMKSGTSTLVLYESTKKKGIFVSGRSYQVLYGANDLNKKGYVAMDVVPIMEDAMPVFEERTLHLIPKLKQQTGLIALRFLKQIKSNQYMMLTQWLSERHYFDWKNSPDFDQTDMLSLARLPAYFAERPFTNTYTMLKEDD